MSYFSKEQMDNLAPTKTVGGSEVRLYSVYTGPHGKIHGAYLGPDDNWHAASWNSTGHFLGLDNDGNQLESTCDLIHTRKPNELIDQGPDVA